MGNIQETVNFVKYIGDPRAFEDETRHPRTDKLYFKASQPGKLTAVALCSSITERVPAVLRIYDTSTEKELLLENILLDHNSNHSSNRYYELKSPIEILKNKFYTIEVSVYQGAVYTYLDSQNISVSPHLLIDVTRKNPRQKARVSKLNIESFATTATISDMESSRKTATSKVPTFERSQTMNISEIQTSTTEPGVSPKKNKRAVTPSSTLTGSFQSFTQRSSSIETQRPRKRRSLERQERIMHMNMICGIHFERKVLTFGCC